MTQTKFTINGPVYSWLYCSDARYNYLRGGASSGKSHTVAQFLIKEYLLQGKNLGIMAVRKTRPAVKSSCWELARHYLNILHEESGRIKPLHRENKSDLILYGPNGNFWRFEGLDNVFKKRSMEGINIVWIEEAAAMGSEAAFSEKEFIQLDMLCRAPGLKRFFLTYNPVDPVGNEWLVIRDDNAEADPDSQRIILRHHDNPFLDAAGHKVIEGLQLTDPEYDKIYRLGEWATPTALIYSKWDVVDVMPDEYEECVWGLDFGYSINPAALIEIRFTSKQEVYERSHLYETGLTNPQLIERLKSILPAEHQLVCDSAEPKSIQELRNVGLNVFGAQKGPDSVQYGIRTVNSCMTHICSDSADLIKEKRGYKWKVDASGEVVTVPRPAPAPFRDHLMDAERYAIIKVLGLAKAGLMFEMPEEEPVEHTLDSDDAGWVGDDGYE